MAKLGAITMRRVSLVFLLEVSLAGLSLALAASQSHDDAAALKEFRDRVGKYESLRNKKGIHNKQSESSSELEQRKQAAAQKVQQTRGEARQGEIFTPRIAAYFKKQIQLTLHGPEGARVRTSLRHAEPLPEVHLQVNEPYPGNVPLQSTPPTLLLNLPALPKGLQYRVVGSTLILYDEPSNLVVDLIPNAVTQAK